MKKIIILMMMLFSTVMFAEKLTTDGKYHFDKVVGGNWCIPDADLTILKKGNNYYMRLPISTFIEEPVLIRPHKDGIFKVKVDNEFWYFAYDIKHKALVMIDKDKNIVYYHSRC